MSTQGSLVFAIGTAEGRTFIGGPADGSLPSPTTDTILTLMLIREMPSDFALEASQCLAENAARSAELQAYKEKAEAAADRADRRLAAKMAREAAEQAAAAERTRAAREEAERVRVLGETFFEAPPARATRAQKRAVEANPRAHLSPHASPAPGSGVCVPSALTPAPLPSAATGAGVSKRARQPRGKNGKFAVAGVSGNGTVAADAGPSDSVAGPSSAAPASAIGGPSRPLVKYHTGDMVYNKCITNPSGGAHKYPRLEEEFERAIVEEREKRKGLSFAQIANKLKPGKLKSWAYNGYLAYQQAWYEKEQADKKAAVGA